MVMLGQSPRTLSQAEVAAIKVNGEGIRFLMLCLAREVHEFAVSRDISHGAVEDQLPFVFGELNRNLGDILDIRCVPARDASSLSTLNIHFSYPTYRRVALAAKDRAAGVVDGD